MSWKLLGGLFILGSSSAMGMSFARRLREQEAWLMEIKKVLLLLNGELNYNKTPLPEALRMISARHKGYLSVFLEEVGDSLMKRSGRTLCEVWQDALEDLFRHSPLSKYQKQEFMLLYECFSGTDEDARNHTLSFYLKRLEAEIEQLEQTGKDKAYLYRMLGMLAGLFLLVLII